MYTYRAILSYRTTTDTCRNRNSADPSTVNIKSGEDLPDIPRGAESGAGIRHQNIEGSGVREAGGADLSNVGRQGVEGLKDVPKDATTN